MKAKELNKKYSKIAATGSWRPLEDTAFDGCCCHVQCQDVVSEVQQCV